jgi:hypothetical protein
MGAILMVKLSKSKRHDGDEIGPPDARRQQAGVGGAALASRSRVARLRQFRQFPQFFQCGGLR